MSERHYKVQIICIFMRLITRFNPLQRQNHVNRCIDKKQKEAEIELSRTPDKISTPHPALLATLGAHKGLAVGMESPNYKCPMCNKKLDRMVLKSRISHLKKCAKEKSMPSSNKETQRTPKPPEIVTSKFFASSDSKKVKSSGYTM
jgi:hypothetical protein